MKTIGDAYMVAGGMPDPQIGHAADVANMALEILDVTQGHRPDRYANPKQDRR
ncbi:adenylate/guanylate cyclase domain-containing protein [Bradyrhizobium sp. OAE829]|uniref:adenylate/guanylate cyclase domain-containing protein n=1 Tax=Bradyrhizobium sp. OAE829 TaxID=2663807 RepID=UPI0033923C29